MSADWVLSMTVRLPFVTLRRDDFYLREGASQRASGLLGLLAGGIAYFVVGMLNKTELEPDVLERCF